MKAAMMQLRKFCMMHKLPRGVVNALQPPDATTFSVMVRAAHTRARLCDALL